MTDPPAAADFSEELAEEIAEEAEAFVTTVPTIAREATGGQAVTLLLLAVARVSAAGARLGASTDFTPLRRYQPDVGPASEAEVDELRLALAERLGEADTYSFVFDPYDPEVVISQLSDDVLAIATDLENGLRHYRSGFVDEALWWWQFSYLSSWGNLAGAALNALLTVVAHDRLDTEIEGEAERVRAAAEMLGEQPGGPR